MAENLDTSLSTTNISNVSEQPVKDVNNQTFDNIQSSAGQQMQQTLFWDYQNNKPPTQLPKSDYSAKYPNLIGGPVSSLNKNKPKTWNDIAQESISAVRQQQGAAGRSLILNPGNKVERYDVNKHNAVGYIRGADNESLHADRLSGLDVAMIGVRNTLVKGSAVALSSIGYLGKLPFAALNGDISSAADNWLSNWADEVRDNPINQIYHPTGYDQKTAFEKLSTGTWWAEQGADMAGFVIGNLLPATWASKIGLLSKGSKLIGNALYATRAGTAVSSVGTELNAVAQLGNNLANNSKWLASMDMLETGMTSAVSEAIFEGADTKKRIYQDLLSKGYTPDQAHDIATRNANTVIGLNTAILLPSSLFEINALLKGGANLKAAAKFIREGGDLTKPGVARYAGNILGGAVQGAIVEGAWEENIQNSIQQVADKISSGHLEPGVGNIFSSLISDSINNFNTQEGQESILGGMVMGVLMGGWKGGKELRNNYKEAEKILPKFQSSYTANEQLAKDMVTLSNYLKDKSNYVTMNNGKEVLDENGNIKINTAKLISDVKSLGLTVDLTNTITNAAENGDFNLQDIAKSQLIGEFVYNHVSNGMTDRMFNKLTAFQNLSEEEKNSLGIIVTETDAQGNNIPFGQQMNMIMSKAREYKSLYDHVEAFFPETLSKDREGNEYGYDTKSIFQEAILNKSILETLRNIENNQESVKSQMIFQFDENIKHSKAYANSFFKNYEGDLESVSDEDKINAYMKIAHSSGLTKNYQKNESSLSEYRKALTASNNRYNKLTDKEAVVKQINKSIESKEKSEDKIKEEENLVQEAIERNKKATQAKGDKDAKQKQVQDLADQLNDPTLTEEERNTKRAERDQLNNEINELNKQIAAGEVEEDAGTGMSLEDMIANANTENVEELDPSMVSPGDGESVSGNPKPRRASDSLKGATKLEKAQDAVDRIIKEYEALGASEDPVTKFGLDKMSEDEILRFYDNKYGAKTEGSEVNFLGRMLQIGDRYKGNDDAGTIWKVKGVDVDNNLIMYAASDAVKTTKVTSLEQLDQMENLSGKVQESKDKKDSTTPKPLEAGLPINTQVSNVFRIPNGNTFLEVFHNSFSMSKEQVSKLVTKMSAQDVRDNMYITFKRETFDTILNRKDELFQPVDGVRNLGPNPNLFQKKGTGFRFQIMLGEEIVGYGTNPNKYVFLDQNKNRVKPENLDINLFSQIYETNQKNPITIDEFKKNYADAVRLYTELYNRLGDQDEISLSINEVSQLLNFKINPGEYDYSSDKQYKLSELEYNTIQGEVYVLDMQNIYEPGTGRVVGRTVTPTISDPLKQDVIDKAIEETFGEAINPDILRSYGRYVAVIQLPNGAVKFVELSTPVLSDEQGSKLLESLVQRQKESFENIDQEESSRQSRRIPKSNLFNDDFNEKLNENLFISVKDKKGIDISMGLTPTGVLRLEINDYADITSPKGTTVYINKDLEKVKSLAELRKMINEAIDSHNSKENVKYEIPFKLDAKAFKKSLGKNVSVDEYLDMQTSVNPGIIKNASIEIEVKDFKQTPYQKKPEDGGVVTVGGKVVEATILQSPEAISTTATQTKDNLDVAKTLTTVENFNAIPSGSIQAKFIEDVLQLIPGVSDNQSIREALDKYVKTFLTKESKPETVVEIAGTPASILQRIEDLKATIEDIKSKGKNKTLTDQDGNSFDDNTARNKYGKALIDKIKLEINSLQEKLPKDSNYALKIVNSQSQASSITSLNEFKDFLKKNLPVYINVQDIDTLVTNLSNNGQTVGIFQTNLEVVNGVRGVTGGTIGTREDNPFKYHEAFHAIFRLLLSETKIRSLLNEAKSEYSSVLRSKGITLQQAINEFKASSSLYSNLSNKQAEERLYEEYMADKFDEWKSNKSVKTSSNIKNFFKKIIDWFKAFTTRVGLSKQDMMGLFEDVNRGKYKNVKIQTNRFTQTQEVLEEGMIDDQGRPIDGLFPIEAALKLIKIGQEETVDEFGNVVVSPRYLTQSQSNKLVGTVTAVFLRRYQGYSGNINQLIEDIMNDYSNLYNSQNESYTDRDDYFDIVDSLDELNFAYSDPESRAALVENINYSLQQLGFKQSEDEQRIEDDTDDLGDRQVGNYTIETSSIGGFGSLSKFLRRYIASTTYPIVDDKGQPIPDQFGNFELIPGEPLVDAVDSNVVYNGLLKALANINDQTVFVNRLVEYAAGNEQSAHFIQRFITDTGLTINEDGSFSISKNPTLFQMVVKGFNQYRVDYMFTQKDARAKVSKIFPSNQRDVAQTQFDLWYNSFTSLYQDQLDKISDEKQKQSFVSDRKKVLDKIRGFLEYKKKLSNPDLDKISEQLSIELNAAYGISLSKNFMRYSIISGMSADIRSQKQAKYFNAFSSVTPLSIEDITEISKTLQKQSNPFVKGQITVQEVDDKSGIDVTSDVEIDDANIGRLKKIAENNAVLDETVGSSSFVNAEGKTVYGHQLPTFHLIATTDLNSRDYRRFLKKDPYLKDNYLLNSKLFNSIADTLRVARIDGLRQVTFSQDENGNFYENRALDVNKREGIVYGSYSDREFLLNLFDMYLYQKENSYTDENNKTIRFNTSPHLIRVLEASNTGDTVALPVQKLFEKGNINQQATNALVNEVVNEYERIQRVKGEIKDIKEGRKKEGIIQDYHNGKLKGLRFFKTSNMLGSLRSELENKAQMEKNYKLTDEDINNIRTQVQDYFRNQVNTLIDQMIQQNILQGSQEKGLSNILLPLEIERGIYTNGKFSPAESEKMNLTENIKDNIGQIFMNDFMNTLAYNQLILNDAAKGLKDSVDEVKRAKGANGSGPSIEARVIAPELGILHQFTESNIGIIAEPKGTAILSATKQEEVDRADAQMWLTVKGLRYTLFGLGKLTEKNARFLDKIEAGEEITKEDVFGEDGSLTYDGQTNSIKLVYYDGKKYIKTSGALLQKQFTSYLDGSVWKAIPGREALHDMREKMEDFESRNNTVMFMVPKSASKAISEDIMKTDLSDFSDEKMKPLSNKFWRLQLENPSNKVVINDPTQAKQLIDMEQDDSVQVLFRGTKISVGDLRKIYQNASEQRVKNNYFKARNSIFNIDDAFSELQSSIDQNKVTPKLAEFQARAIETLQASGSDSQLLGFFELDEQGNPKYNLNMPLTLDKYTQLFLAYFSKGVTNEKVPGHAVALMSDFGVQIMRQVTEIDPVSLKPTKWRNIRADQFKAASQRYFFKDLDTDMFSVGDYFTSDLQHNVPEYNEQGEITGYYSEFMLPAHFAELMDIKPGDEIPEAVAKAFGVRIPSQDKHSFISLKMVDFMPANMGSTGIFAKELIKLSGADFDIDKLYMSIASWYTKKGKFLRYGDEATTDQDRFDEFLHYELNNNKDLKKLVKKKLKANQDYNDLRNDLKLYNASQDGDGIIEGIEEDYQSSIISWDEVLSLKPDEVNAYINNKASELKKTAINESLTELGLPSILSEFIEQSKKGELNNGVLNNIILDAKIQMLTNDHIRPEIATEAAGVDLLAQMTTDPDLVNSVIQEANLDTDSILGKTAAFRNNKEGANNIGPAVNAMLVYSLLNKYGIKLRTKGGEEEIFKLSIDGNTFDTYENTIATDGNRIMNNISTVVSAMTDNAKERLAAKLNMSMSSISTLANMLAQGVPMKTVTSILLQPSIKEYFSATKRFSNKFKSVEDRMVNGEQINRADIGKKLLETYQAQIPEGQFDPNYKLTTEELLSVTRGESNNPMLQWKVLSDFMKMESQAKYFASVSQIIKLSKGLGTNFEYGDAIRENMDKLGIDLSDKEFAESQIPFDARQVLTGKDKSKPYHNITANYIAIFNQINELAKSLFIEKTDTFTRIKDIVFSNLDFSKDEYNIPEEELKMKRNLISYLSFKAYQKLMKDENKNSRLTSLSNKLLYDSLDTDNSYKDITERLEEARRIAPNNYLINKFLIKNSTTVRLKGEIKENKNNKDGINKVESNTWSRISNSMSEKLQDSFRELYNDPNTKQYAVDLFNYLIVKDGLQFKSGSFLKLIPNFMFYDVLRGASKANEIMKLDTKSFSQSELDQKYKDTFELSQVELFNEFTNVYLSNINNAFHIPQITKLVKNNQPKTGVRYTNNLQNELVIDIFADVRKEEIKTYTQGNKLITEAVKKSGKLDPSEKERFIANLQEIKDSGFVLEDIEEMINNEKRRKLQVNFPYIVSIQKSKGVKTYYKLTKVDNIKDKGIESKASNFISRGDTVAKGTRAVYTEIKLKGSRTQTPIAQMFGELPDSDSLRKPKKDLQRSTNLEDTNPSIMEGQSTEEFNSELNNIFGVSSDGQNIVSDRQGTLPQPNLQEQVLEGQSDKLDTDKDAPSIFYSAVDDNFDVSTIDSSFFKDENEEDINNAMEGMDVTDNEC